MTNRRVTFTILVALAFGLAAYQFSERSERVISRRILKPAERVSSFMRAIRPNYPYSVVRGGVYSPAELRSAVQNDSLVREHYSGFNVKAARLVTLDEDRFQYVSYRQNNKIFWTNRRIRIPKGEVLLTDGSSCARTRCGNRLSATLQGPVKAHEPSSALLTLPDEKPEEKPETLTVGPIVFTPSPSFGDIAEEADTLSPDFPRTAAGTAPMESPFEGSGIGSFPNASSPGISGMMGGGFPGVITNTAKLKSAALEIASAVISGQTPPAILAVPEPRRLPIAILASYFSFWLLVRLRRGIRV